MTTPDDTVLISGSYATTPPPKKFWADAREAVSATTKTATMANNALTADKTSYTRRGELAWPSYSDARFFCRCGTNECDVIVLEVVPEATNNAQIGFWG